MIAEDLNCATTIAKKYSYRFKIVTLDGQVVNAGGSLTGGSLNRNTGLLSRANEIETLKSRLQSLNRNQKMPKTEVLKFLVNIRHLKLSFSVHRQTFQIFDKTL